VIWGVKPGRTAEAQRTQRGEREKKEKVIILLINLPFLSSSLSASSAPLGSIG
jgi:hypothetical protein